MPNAKLTDAQCRSAAPTAKPRKLFDGGGLALVVLPSGAKSWRLFARRPDGKQATVSLGLYPALSLAAARKAAQEARERLQRGEATTARPAPVLTLENACAAYWAGRRDVTDGYRSNATRGLEMHILPTLGKRPVSELTRAEVLAALTTLDARGRHVYVRRVRVWLAQVLDWCVEREHCAANVARLIDPERAFARATVKHHAAIGLDEVPALMQRMALERDLLSVLSCRLLALTWVRTAELRSMRWDEIDGDLWRIPEGRMKRRRDHLVPLSRQALRIIEQLRARCRGSVFVMPSDRREDRPQSENSVLYLLHRIGYAGRMTGHGWRSVGSTWAHERGYPSEAIEMQLAHASESKVASAYNRALYIDVRRRMLQDFADWLMPDG